MKLLVSNVGSTSLKFKLFEMPEEHVYCEAKVERVKSTESDAIFSYRNLENGFSEYKEGLSIPNYTVGIQLFLDHLTDPASGVIKTVDEIAAIGFKTVLARGFYGVHELTDEVMAAMHESLFVAPVHNSAYIEAIECFNKVLPNVKKIGVFETAFHTTIPQERRVYSVPYEWYEKYGIARMGYHGASHSYIAEQAAKRGKAGRVISCHLGGSCSICAIRDGKSVDTSFGWSLQTGVLHANRAGDVDPYIIPYLLHEGLSLEEILKGYEKNGGLKGISGVSNDLRTVMEAAEGGNARAKLAVDVFVTDIVRYIGSFYAELGGLDQLVFTGGIGEHSEYVRKAVCASLTHFGIELDEKANSEKSSAERTLSTPDSAVMVSVIPANEELGVARRSYECVNKA
jgi:acetate kinase